MNEKHWTTEVEWTWRDSFMFGSVCILVLILESTAVPTDSAQKEDLKAADAADAAAVCVVPVRTPLSHVAVHVVQAPWIGLLHANFVSVFFASIQSIAVKPRVPAQL